MKRIRTIANKGLDYEFRISEIKDYLQSSSVVFVLQQTNCMLR